MPTIEYRGETVECESGERLRDVLLGADLPVHNGPRAVSCHGLATCGTCAVEVEVAGDGELPGPTRRERARMAVPPHSPDSGLRLACQVRVTADLVVEKRDGFWGQHVDASDE
ncbi:MAG: 2Fe-2S iron-sulfur cluster-binding protein [Haloarculaceae archaeon]